MNSNARRNASYTAFTALILLIYGWGMGGFSTVSGVSAAYEASVQAFNWTLKIGGIAMALTAAICFAGVRAGLLLDFIVSGMCGVIMILCGGYWLYAGGQFNLQDALILVFGLMFVRAAMGSLNIFNSTADAPAESAFPVVVEQPHPASIKPEVFMDSTPSGDYLSTLAKEDQKPPTASYE